MSGRILNGDGLCSRRVVPTQRQRFKGVVQPSGNAGGYWLDFLSKETTVSRSMLAEQNEPSPYNHHLQQFLTFLKQESAASDSPHGAHGYPQWRRLAPLTCFPTYSASPQTSPPAPDSVYSFSPPSTSPP